MKMAVAVILMLVLFAAQSNELTVNKVAVEGVSINVDILCNLVRQFHPLYWRIQGRIYDLFSIPELFIIREHEAITIPTVDRRMDGWDFQCFTVDPRQENSLHPGQITNLTVWYDRNVAGPDNSVDLLQSSTHGRVVLHYKELQVEPDFTTISWLYSPNSLRPCVSSEYGIDLYLDTDINTVSLADQEPAHSFQASNKIYMLNSQLLNDSYLRISTLQNCGSSPYFYNLNINDAIRRDIYTNETSASFEIPENLHNNQSLQWVWSKDDNIQCVCPPVEQFMSQCACNIENPNSNTISISNNHIFITNLHQDNGMGEVILHVISSVSSGCLRTCNLKSIVAVYRIVIATQGFPAPPNLRVIDTNMLCFTVPNNPIHPEVFEVNLTDSTGSLTRLSGVYSTSKCLNITSDLYPGVCWPFQVSVAAINTAGREVTQLAINGTLPYGMATPCDCYQKKGMVHLSSTVTSTSASLTFTCEYNEDIILAVSATEATQEVTIACNSTVPVVSLNSSTDYNVSTVLKGSRISCYLHHFRTSHPADKTLVIVAAVVPTVVAINVILIITVLICTVIRKYTTKQEKTPTQGEEEEAPTQNPS